MTATECITVTLPIELLEEIDRLEPHRARFIVEAVEHELTRRRRDALLLSIQNPHPETTALATIRLSGWTSDLPGGETLVDAKAGTAVRWVQGQGWTRE